MYVCMYVCMYIYLFHFVNLIRIYKTLKSKSWFLMIFISCKTYA